MAFTPTYPLDLYNLLITMTTGTETIFIFASLFLIAGFAARMRFPNIITISLFMVYGLIMGVVFQKLLIITVLVISIMVFMTFNRIFNR